MCGSAPPSPADGWLARALTTLPCPLPPQVVLFPYGEDKEYIDEYKRYKGPINVTDFKDYVFKSMPDLTRRLDGQESISAFIHTWAASTGCGGMWHPRCPPPAALMYCCGG
jgi:hypothetical protein